MEKLAVSVIVPVMNETISLRKTVRILVAENAPNIHEILIVVSPKFTTAESRAVISDLQKEYKQLRVVEQQKPYLGGALQDAFEVATGTHFLLMASDLETNPSHVKHLIARMRAGNVDIVATTRWSKRGGFRGYNPVKWLLNWVFQKMVAVLYGARLTDLTFGFRLYRREALQGFHWTELRHPFLLECILKPLRAGFTVTEIPSDWTARTEGVSQNTFLANFAYVRTAWRIRFAPRKSI